MVFRAYSLKVVDKNGAECNMVFGRITKIYHTHTHTQDVYAHTQDVHTHDVHTHKMCTHTRCAQSVRCRMIYTDDLHWRIHDIQGPLTAPRPPAPPPPRPGRSPSPALPAFAGRAGVFILFSSLPSNLHDPCSSFSGVSPCSWCCVVSLSIVFCVLFLLVTSTVPCSSSCPLSLLFFVTFRSCAF